MRPCDRNGTFRHCRTSAALQSASKRLANAEVNGIRPRGGFGGEKLEEPQCLGKRCGGDVVVSLKSEDRCNVSVDIGPAEGVVVTADDLIMIELGHMRDGR